MYVSLMNLYGEYEAAVDGDVACKQDWISDSDGNDDYDWGTHEADLVPASDGSAGPSKKAKPSGGEENHDSGDDSGWDTDEGAVRAHGAVSAPSPLEEELYEGGS
ncbi:uncharacterized protein A4U43_C04F9110 [Asparagus officinalis]|uniref:Uncharacterized protein n=1 Tax=Asparagus officinalis TaxID=4686 RepID=A0A5P1EZW6_ASPOF|nr:uncharacterized protein A4U43_C04F9110 [Asparagus officinalis]